MCCEIILKTSEEDLSTSVFILCILRPELADAQLRKVVTVTLPTYTSTAANGDEIRHVLKINLVKQSNDWPIILPRGGLSVVMDS